MTIGTLADRTDVSVETVRYYERRGLLPKPPRSDGGFRLYGEADEARLHFVLRAKTLGFTLNEISTLLAVREGAPEDAAALVREQAQRKLDALDQRLARLGQMRATLARLVEACPGEGPDCPILDAMEEPVGESS